MTPRKTQIRRGHPHDGGELAWIDSIRRRALRTAGPDLRLGIGDDCALLRLRPGEELAVTTDLSIAGRHFRLDWHPADSIGHRTLARGLSDLAAMGARPVAAFLSLGIPAELTQQLKKPNQKCNLDFKPQAMSQFRPRAPQQYSKSKQQNKLARNVEAASRLRSGLDSSSLSLTGSWLDRFLEGFFALAETCRVPLAGGDLAESPIALADIVLTGAVPHGQALLRSGAQPGDLLYVTGLLGGSAAGLAHLAELAAAAGPPRPTRRQSAAAILRPEMDPATLAPHLYPQPRIPQGLWLRKRGLATAALDISDGLSTDLAHLCDESGVAARVHADQLPIAPGATLDQALHGGEDYELLFAARPSARIPRRIAGVPTTCIGEITVRRRGQPTAVLLDGSGEVPLEPRGWEHFSAAADETADSR